MSAPGDRAVRSGSLRRRVVLSTVALLLVIMVALGFLVDVILSDRLHSDLRHQLTERATYAGVLAGRGLVGQELADDLTGQGITGSVKSDGHVYIGRNQLPAPPGARPGGGPFGRGFPGAPGGNPGARPVPVGHITLSEHGSSLTATVSLGSSDLLLSTSEADIDHTMSVLRTVELGAGLATLIVGGLLSFAIVGGALSPLVRMTELADRIRAGDRGRRLRPNKPNTDLGRTATALDAMLDSLEDAEAEAQNAELRMRTFLADASHDLRTPLAGMLASAEQLLRSDPGRAEREQRLVDLIREGRRAGRLVDDLLLMARLDGPDPSLALLHGPVELAEIVDAAVRRLRLVGPDRTISLERPDRPVVVLGDADRLARILSNLLDNARDATTAGGRIAIELSREDGVAVVDVRDDGRGIPATDHERVFDRFVRLDETRRTGGSGLGLPIARAIARGHDGSLVSLPVPHGAHFRLTLPAVAQPIPADDLREPALR